MPQTTKRYILLIETDADVCKALSRLLSKDFDIYANVVTASDHASGLNLLKRTPDRFSIVITNLGRSQPDFMNFLREAHETSPKSLFVLFTGGSYIQLHENELDAVVFKPDLMELVHTVKTLLK